MTEISLSIIQKVKDELNVNDDLTSTELYDLLHKHRSSQHPDKYFDDETKKDAEERFKNLNLLLLELSKLIEKEKQQKKPSEIVLFEKDYEIIKTKQIIINYEEEILILKRENSMHKRNIKSLNSQLLKLQGDKAEEKAKDLIQNYIPSKKSLISQGILFILTLIIAIISKIEDIADIMKKYFPFDQLYFNLLIFAILTIIPIRFILLSYEEKKIENMAKRIRTPLLINRFVQYLTHKEIKVSFTEMNVFDFLSVELAPNSFHRRIWYTKIFNLYSETTIDSLKVIFIYNLLNKQLITISGAEQLDRKFKMSNSNYPPHYDLDDFTF